MFHVKHAQGWKGKKWFHFFICQPQGVGLWRSHSPNMYNMLVSRSHSSEPQDVAIASLLPCFLMQSPTFANRGNGDKLVYRHFRGAASCDCFLIALHSGAIANAFKYFWASGCHPGGCRDSTKGQEVDPGIPEQVRDKLKSGVTSC